MAKSLQILMLDLMLNQLRNRKVVPSEVISRIHQELDRMTSLGDSESLQDYLIKHNGKKMKGTDKIWKFRLTAGDRILYTYGRYLPSFQAEYRGAIILLGYAKHDDQAFFAKESHFELEKKHVDVAEYINQLKQFSEGGDIQEIDPDDLYEIAEILSLHFRHEHAAYVIPDMDLINISSKDLDENPILSEEQGRCIESFCLSPQPTLVLGGAGTGKTLIAIHILNNVISGNHESFRAAYFTQSRELRNSVEKRFCMIADNEDIPAVVMEINEYCLAVTGRSGEMGKMMNQTRFTHGFFANLPKEIRERCSKQGIDSLTAWTEIRGVVKGQLDPNWRRNMPLPQSRIPGQANVSRLENSGWIKRDSVNPQNIYLAMDVDFIQSRISVDTQLSGSQKEALTFIADHFSRFDTQLVDMGKEKYFSLDAENTTLDLTQRKTLWNVYIEYCRYLKSENLFDDNDLARETISLIQQQEKKFEKFNLVIVDEVQDYTEVQIRLLDLLSADGRSLVYAGDANQNVNPTAFREEKLQRLYLNRSNKKTALVTRYLTGNYRCPLQTVRVTNALSELRRSIVARGKAEREEPEISKRWGTEPTRLIYSESNVRQILNTMANYPRTAFLVPDEVSKQEIIRMIGEKKYVAGGVPFVHTVAEIKGMEYAYVVCFNLFGQFHSVWSEMLLPEHQKKNTGERYYFNLPYVAMTRTQEHLCVIDKHTHSKLEQQLGLSVIQTFDHDQLHFSALKMDTEEWLRAAREHEAKGLYEDAAGLYRKAGASARNIKRCESKYAADIGDYASAVCNAMIAHDLDPVRLWAKQLIKGSNIEILTQILLYFGSLENAQVKVAELVDDIFRIDKYSTEEIIDVKLFCIEQLDDLLNRYMDQAEEWLADSDERWGTYERKTDTGTFGKL